MIMMKDLIYHAHSLKNIIIPGLDVIKASLPVHVLITCLIMQTRSLRLSQLTPRLVLTYHRKGLFHPEHL